MSRPHFLRSCPPPRLLISLVLLASSVTAAAAAEVQWRPDYNSARREAQEKGRPLVVDVGTDQCFWCTKLDASTFRDPAVVKVMNEQFIPVRINAAHDPTVPNALNIQSFP